MSENDPKKYEKVTGHNKNPELLTLVSSSKSPSIYRIIFKKSKDSTKPKLTSELISLLRDWQIRLEGEKGIFKVSKGCSAVQCTNSAVFLTLLKKAKIINLSGVSVLKV